MKITYSYTYRPGNRVTCYISDPANVKPHILNIIDSLNQLPELKTKEFRYSYES